MTSTEEAEVRKILLPLIDAAKGSSQHKFSIFLIMKVLETYRALSKGKSILSQLKVHVNKQEHLFIAAYAFALFSPAHLIPISFKQKVFGG